jgi:hypothetical protein
VCVEGGSSSYGTVQTHLLRGAAGVPEAYLQQWEGSLTERVQTQVQSPLSMFSPAPHNPPPPPPAPRASLLVPLVRVVGNPSAQSRSSGVLARKRSRR